MAFGFCEQLTKTLDCEWDPKATIEIYEGLAKAAIVFTARNPKHEVNRFENKRQTAKAK